jgi:hypothetical protein
VDDLEESSVVCFPHHAFLIMLCPYLALDKEKQKEETTWEVEELN